MWALLSTRLRTWLLLTVAVPLGAALARRLAHEIERRRGPSGLTRALHRAGELADRRRGHGRRHHR